MQPNHPDRVITAEQTAVATVYIVEDHPVMQRMLRDLLNRLPNLRVGGVAGTAQEATGQILNREMDLVLVDVSLPDMNGIELVQALRAKRPNLRCLMLSGHQESNYVQHALAVGARGYIAKGNPLELQEAINQVLRGEIYLSASLREAIA